MRDENDRYALGTRLLHWLSFLLIAGLIPVGFIMAQRGAANLWDSLTNTLYASHKAIGFTVLVLVVLRIGLRMHFGAPAMPRAVAWPQAAVAHTVHYALYVLLLAIPLAGWAGVTAYPALVTLGGYNLPPMPLIPQNQELAAQFFTIHRYAVYGLLGLLALHVGAALMHLVVKRDGVFGRMGFGER